MARCLNFLPRNFEGIAEKIYGFRVERSLRRNEFEVSAMTRSPRRRERYWSPSDRRLKQGRAVDDAIRYYLLASGTVQNGTLLPTGTGCLFETMLTRPLAATSHRSLFFLKNARHATNHLLGELSPTDGLEPRKGETSMRRTIIAIAAAAVLGMAAMTTGAMAAHGGGGGHGGGGHFGGGGGHFAGGGGHYGGGGGHFAGGGGHYGGGAGRGYGLGLGAVGISAGLYGYAGNSCDFGGPYYDTPYCGSAYNSW